MPVTESAGTSNRVIFAIAVGFSLLCGLMLIPAWNALKYTVEGEKVSNAVHLMAIVVSKSIEQSGHWPASVQDLDAVPNAALAAFQWPDDRDRLFQRVIVDYDLTPADLAALTPDNFQAIRPSDSRYLTTYWQRHLFERLEPALKKLADDSPHSKEQ